MSLDQFIAIFVIINHVHIFNEYFLGSITKYG